MERITTKASREAYKSEELHAKNENTKYYILEHLEKFEGKTIREIAKGINEPYNQVQKRVFDLFADGRVVSNGSKLEGDHKNTTYKFVSYKKQKQRKSQLTIFKEKLKHYLPVWYDLICEEAEKEYKRQ